MADADRSSCPGMDAYPVHALKLCRNFFQRKYRPRVSSKVATPRLRAPLAPTPGTKMWCRTATGSICEQCPVHLLCLRRVFDFPDPLTLQGLSVQDPGRNVSSFEGASLRTLPAGRHHYFQVDLGT